MSAHEEIEAILGVLESEPRKTGLGGIVPSDVFAVEPSEPRYRVRGLVQFGGLSMTWATRGGLKSYLELAQVLVLLQPDPCGELFGVPGLEILGGYEKVLWLACEESAARLHHRADRIIRGMGLRQPRPGQLIHLPARGLAATGEKFVLALDNLPELVEQYHPDCVVVDYLTGFRRLDRGIVHDLDNDAAHEATRPLREIAAVGVDMKLIHHANAAGERARGASEYGNAVDTEIHLKSFDDGRVSVVVEKQKDAARLKPFFLSVDWSDGATRIEYAGEGEVEALTPKEAAAIAYLEGVGAEGDPEKRTSTAVAETLKVGRPRASEILNSGKRKGRLGSTAGRGGRSEWFVVSELSHSETDTCERGKA